MDKDTLVSCMDCINWESLLQKQESYFGCNTALCKKCVCGDNCDCYAPESNKRFEVRPNFVLRMK